MSGFSPNPDELLFVPLGGCGEIGMNLNLYGLGGKWLMVDLGVTFGDDSVPGIDVVMPDPSFIVERRDDLLALVVTHAHEDHLGAVPYLWRQLQCPVYVSAFAAEYLRRKLEEVGFADVVPVHIVGDGDAIDIGPFNVTYHAITHSIPESHALAIRTPLGNILHTGDWKLDPEPLLGGPTDPKPFAEFGREGVLAMVCDSTNVFLEGTSGSESEVRDSLTDIVGRATQRVVITTFASHVARLQTLIHVAAQHDRNVVLVGRSLLRAAAAARSVGYFGDDVVFVPEREAGLIPADKCLIICTGCQGESRAALAKIAFRTHQHVALDAGDTVIFSSKIIPGNEREIAAVQNRLIHSGVEVITEQDEFVHVSGHPARDELATMYGWVRPKISIPVHGEARHLAEHAQFALSLQVPDAFVLENGAAIRLAPGAPAVVDYVEAGRLYRDGDRLIRADSGIGRDRRNLARSGSIAVVVVMKSSGRLAVAPRIISYGVTDSELEHDREIEQILSSAIASTIERLPTLTRRRDEDLENEIRRSVRSCLKRTTGTRPLIDVEIVRIPKDGDAPIASGTRTEEVVK